MDFSAIFAPLTNWMDAHPSAVSWLLGWIGAIVFGQTAKQFLPCEWNVTAAKRMVQVIATTVGTLVAFLLWPLPVSPAVDHRFIYALLCGMSAPTAYTFMKALIETRWPTLAYRLSWSRVQDRNSPDNTDGDGCDHPDCLRKKGAV